MHSRSSHITQISQKDLVRNIAADSVLFDVFASGMFKICGKFGSLSDSFPLDRSSKVFSELPCFLSRKRGCGGYIARDVVGAVSTRRFVCVCVCECVSVCAGVCRVDM